jgi:hypothetical protein
MPEIRTEPELPIVWEIGEALYAAAVASDRRVARRRRSQFGRPALAATIVLAGVGASASGLALAGTFTPASRPAPSRICALLRAGRPPGLHILLTHRGYVVACPLPPAKPSRPSRNGA